MVIFLGDRIFGGKPDILLRIQRILEAAPSEALNGTVQVVHALKNARALKLMNQFSRLGSVLSRKDKLCLSRSRNDHLGGLVDVAVGVTGQSNRFLPVFHAGLDAFYHDRSTEHGAVHNRTDRTVGTLPHLF